MLLVSYAFSGFPNGVSLRFCGNQVFAPFSLREKIGEKSALLLGSRTQNFLNVIKILYGSTRKSLKKVFLEFAIIELIETLVLVRK
jgi:hypothetical protein